MWRLIMPILALAVLAASFMRAGDQLLVLGCVGLALLLALPRPWAARLAQAVLVLAALRWVWLAWVIGSTRAAMGIPYTRMALILGAVALFSLISALVFQSGRLRRYYGLAARQPG